MVKYYRKRVGDRSFRHGNWGVDESYEDDIGWELGEARTLKYL